MFEYAVSYVTKAVQGFMDDIPETRRMPAGAQTTATAGNEARPLDYRLTAVVDRYLDRHHERVAVGKGHAESGIETEEISSLTERLSRMPTIMDPSMWKVHVQVSL